MIGINNSMRGSDSPRPQSGPLNPRKQWHIPATQSPFPKQLLGQSSMESSREQSRDFLSNVIWKNRRTHTHTKKKQFSRHSFPSADYFRLLMTVMSIRSISHNVHISLHATRLSVTYVPNKWADLWVGRTSFWLLILLTEMTNLSSSQNFQMIGMLKKLTFAILGNRNLMQWLLNLVSNCWTCTHSSPCFVLLFCCQGMYLQKELEG